MTEFNTILVPVDFSDRSNQAAEFGASLAMAHKAGLYLLHVTDPIPKIGRIGAGFSEAVQQANIPEKLAKLSEIISDGVKAAITVKEIHISGTPVHRVIVEKAADLGVDLIVLPAPGPKGLGSFLKKNVVELVMQQASCHVLFMR